jgi:hypothetical protein
MAKYRLRIFALGFTVVVGVSEMANAMEDVTPYLPGISIGVPIGDLPPPGLYYQRTDVFFDLHIMNQNGKSTGISVHDYIDVNHFLYVPPVPQVFGATYGAFVDVPIRYLNVGLPTGTARQFGMADTVVSPINLSWNLHNGLFVSFGLVTFMPDGTYNVGNAINIGRNYFTAEPGIGISYLANDWNITLHPVIDINATNPANGYHSGAAFLMDYTVAHKFGALELGVGGTLTAQFTNDTVNGVPVAAVPNVHGYGNRASQFDIGPVVGYKFDKFAVSAYYARDVYAYNNGGGNHFYFKVDVPLGFGGTSTPAPGVVYK